MLKYLEYVIYLNSVNYVSTINLLCYNTMPGKKLITHKV